MLTVAFVVSFTFFIFWHKAGNLSVEIFIYKALLQFSIAIGTDSEGSYAP